MLGSSIPTPPNRLQRMLRFIVCGATANAHPTNITEPSFSQPSSTQRLPQIYKPQLTPSRLDQWAVQTTSPAELAQRATIADMIIKQSNSNKLTFDHAANKMPNDIADDSKELFIEGNLDLSNFNRVTSLPEGLKVTGQLDLFNCKSLTHLPDSLGTIENLELNFCVSLTHLPDNLKVTGKLALRWCESLTHLPENLQVGEELFLSACTSLTHLPTNLQVGWDLDCRSCTSLTCLPDNLQLGGNLDCRGCTELRALPNCIISLGPKANEQMRIIDLTTTGLNQNVLDNLRASDHPGIQFIFGREANSIRLVCNTLQDAIKSWSDVSFDIKKWSLTSQESDNLTTFLARLHETAEANTYLGQASLKVRVEQLLNGMGTSSDFRSSVLESIEQGLESCDDRIILIMNTIETLTRIQAAKKSTNPQALYNLGRSLLALEVVHRHGAAKVQASKFVDPIEVYLALEIHLAKTLNLPVSTRHMLFEACANLTAQEIQATRIDALNTINDPAQVQEYLHQWQPWQQYERQQAMLAINPHQLKQAPERLDATACLISGDELHEIVSPVQVGTSLYSFDSLMNWWVDKGTNPATQQQLAVSDIYSLNTQQQILPTPVFESK